LEDLLPVIPRVLSAISHGRPGRSRQSRLFVREPCSVRSRSSMAIFPGIPIGRDVRFGTRTHRPSHVAACTVVCSGSPAAALTKPFPVFASQDLHGCG
jgi:hypothetical protein